MDRDVVQVEAVGEFRVTFEGTHLADARDKVGLSQTELAVRLGVSQQYVNKLEHPRLQCRRFTAEQIKVLKAIGFVA